MTKEELALEVIRRLKEEYPDAGCTLDYNEAWKLLVSVRLAAQCTDARVNVVVQDLYARYPTVDALAEADVEEIEAIVRPCGLGRSKARDISGCMKILKEQYGGKVPEDFDALLKLPGVGRKSANLIMGMCSENQPLSRIPTASGSATALVWWTASKSRKKWRWHSGRSFPRRRAAISAIGWCITAGMCVPPGPSLIAGSAAWRISAEKRAWRSDSRPPGKPFSHHFIRIQNDHKGGGLHLFQGIPDPEHLPAAAGTEDHGLFPVGVTAFRFEKSTAAPGEGVYFFGRRPGMFGDDQPQLSGADAGQDFVHDPGQQETYQDPVDQIVQAPGDQQGSGGHDQQVGQERDPAKRKVRARFFYGKHDKIRSAGGGTSGVDQGVAQAVRTPAQRAARILSPRYRGSRGATTSMRKEARSRVRRERRKKRRPRMRKQRAAMGRFSSRDSEIARHRSAQEPVEDQGDAADSGHGKSGRGGEIDDPRGGQHGACGFQKKIGQYFPAAF